MDAKKYLELLEQRLQRYFDKKPLPPELPFALVAELHAADEGYFFIPSIKTYSVQHNEYLFVQCFATPLTNEMLQPYLDYLRGRMNALQTTTEHMSSLFTLVCVCDTGIAPELAAIMQKYKYHKDYCFSLKGWSDLAIFLIDTPQEKIFYNKAGKKTAALFDFVQKK